MKYWREPLDKGKVQIDHGLINIIPDRCKGCGFCVEFCPRGVLKESPEFNKKGYHPVTAIDANQCLDCGLCELICPEFALSITTEKKEKESNV